MSEGDRATSPCAFCGQRLQGELAPHLCASCGLAQPVSGAEDRFAALGAPRRFAQDLEALERRFYRLSRALHPDRFSTASAEARKASLERMSLLNEAWSTLKNPLERREHLLALEGVKRPEGSGADARSQIPMELAEGWFELQDALVEEPETAADRIVAFERELEEFARREAEEISKLERAYDSAPSRQTLEKIAELSGKGAYLASLKRDIVRIKARDSGRS